MTVTPEARLARALEPVRAAFPSGDVWLVGGAVRDVLLGHPLTDWDLVTTGDPEETARAFARAAGEYGSIIFIAGNLPNISEIAPLLIVINLEQYDYAGAAAVGVVMLGASFIMLLALNALQSWAAKRR